MSLRLENGRGSIRRLWQRLKDLHPRQLLERERQRLEQQRRLLRALSPDHVLERGFCLVRSRSGALVRTIDQVSLNETIEVELRDGRLEARVSQLTPASNET